MSWPDWFATAVTATWSRFHPRGGWTNFRRLLGHRQVTDAYLLGVAATNNAVLLTLDRRLTPQAAARPHVEVAAP